MTTKAELIVDLLASTDLSNQEIAKRVGCRDAYVRVVQQRLLGGGQKSRADRNYAERYTEIYGVQRCAHRYRTDPVFRKRHNGYGTRKREADKIVRETQ